MLGGGSLTCAADQLSSPFPGLRPSLAYPRPSPRTASPPFVPSLPRLGSHPIEAATPTSHCACPLGAFEGLVILLFTVRAPTLTLMGAWSSFLAPWRWRGRFRACVFTGSGNEGPEELQPFQPVFLSPPAKYMIFNLLSIRARCSKCSTIASLDHTDQYFPNKLNAVAEN